MEKRNTNRKNLQVIVNFNFEGHEKVYDSTTLNISSDGIYIKADPIVLSLMNKGESVIVFIEFKKDFFIRTTGYLVRMDKETNNPGFAMKFLELSKDQEDIITDLINTF